MSKNRVIAIYLPQFHPTEINNKIWGKGFTEWTNVALAKPQFKGHYQPQIPSELGFYDLRLDEVRIEQAKLAKQYGIEGFCYWHYWFGDGKKALEMPFQRLLETKEPDFPFCLAWANHSWSTKTWNNVSKNSKEQEFLKQEYLGKEDYIKHFNYVLPAFKDQRYICVDGKPLFAIFNPKEIPEDELKKIIDLWNRLARENGLKGIHFVARVEKIAKLTDSDIKERIKGSSKDFYQKYLDMGFDAIWPESMRKAEILSKGFFKMFIKRVLYHSLKIRLIDKYNYKDIINNFYNDYEKEENVYPMIIPRWDKTPRQGKIATIYQGSSPKIFKKHVKDALELVKSKKSEHQIIFLQAWNEWGEGNYIEPDVKFGRGYLEALKEALDEENKE
ncbi:MAG: glycoside hydrolase family 99-like domain-containing protein [Bacilli bacterium]|nr:glycoside hydrolase family 99-like domain-containing protein [Bacilli bacterium]